MRTVGTIVALVLMTFGAGAQTLDFSGKVSVQGWWYPESPLFPEQRPGTAGLIVEPTLYGEVGERVSFTFSPFYRYDSADSQRTHGDLREAYLLTFGEWGETAWELRLGLDRVFWGVAESHNVVDVVNQVDFVEHPRNRPKLGQPMAHLTFSGDWGVAETFLLPYFRERSFPGRSGRPRSSLPIDENASYESDAEERHVDYAFRYTHSLGALDFGLSSFIGTNREPSFILSPGQSPSSSTTLVPHYEQIRQFGVDAQVTTGAWLYKMEAMHRSGARNLLGQEEDYQALVLGLEHTLYAVFGSTMDLTVFAEWLYDDRGARSTSIWANDLFFAGTLTFNDAEDTRLVASLLNDLRHDYRLLTLQFERRLSDSWLMRLEMITVLSSDPQELSWGARRDSFLGFDVSYSF